MLFSSPASIPERTLLRAVREDVIAISVEIWDEIARILRTKGGWSDDRITDLLGRYLWNAAFVQLTGKLRVCRNPKDNMFLECAVLAGADLIVSGDRDLLELKSHQGIRIVQASEYLLLEGLTAL